MRRGGPGRGVPHFAGCGWRQDACVDAFRARGAEPLSKRVRKGERVRSSLMLATTIVPIGKDAAWLASRKD